MFITEELKNVKKFESVGFSHEQAEALAESLEQAVAGGHENLKDFFRNEINGLESRWEVWLANLRTDITNLKADIMASQKDLLLKIFAIVTGVTGIAVTILKLFPPN